MSNITDNERRAIASAREHLDAAEAEMRLGGGHRAAAVTELYDAAAAVGHAISASAMALERYRIEDAMARRAAEADEKRR